MIKIPENIKQHLKLINKELNLEIIKNTEFKGNKRYWKIFQLHNKRNRYIFDEYKNGNITSEVYYELYNRYLDKSLIAKWRKKGYEKLCCLRCIQTSESKFETVCICRVPRKKIDGVLCDNCGCNGCSGK